MIVTNKNGLFFVRWLLMRGVIIKIDFSLAELRYTGHC